ncbi:SurA N-terminal domain-containing protein [Emcibacteraceae bacterium]|jgi:peptidyl-prolyl cis-trans isomerase D|nr:SurA N-terminal domain-containing protein [Emcibacteraceae bacterium]|tara:strand:+ start:35465 stop:37387 length:1923 start_codon:yes stop_codon:yes gene_type:complete
MFDFFRKGMGSIFAGGLLAMLIASFVLWGVGDPLSTLGSDDIAEVGDEKITPFDLERAFESEYLRIQQQAGDSLTRELAIQVGIGSQAIAKLVELKAYDVETSNLGLRTSDEDLRDYIYNIQTFQDETGQFNRSYFDQYTRSQGYTTKDFEALLREEMARASLIESLIGNVISSDIATTTLTKYASEERTSEILAIPASLMTGIGEVNDEILKTYFEENKLNYMSPEYRDISYFEVSAATVASTISIGNEEVIANYESRISEFTREEERSFVQMFFDDLEMANKAYTDLENGKSFSEVIVDRTGDTQDEATFDPMPKNEITDNYGEEITTLIYNASLNGYTEPINTDFGVYIFKIISIKPGSSQTVEDVREIIVNDLKMERAIDTLFDIRNLIDDELAAGSPINIVAEAAGVPLKTVSNFNIEGMTPDGSASTELPLIVDFIDYSFRNNIGEELELYEGVSNKFYMLSVDNIIVSNLQDFVDVRDTVDEDWSQFRRETLASELASRISSEYETAENIDKTLAEYEGLLSQLTVNEVIVSRANDNVVSSEIHSSIFSQDVGSIKVIPASNGDGSVIIRVKDRTFGINVDESVLIDTKAQIQRSYQNDLMQSYITHLYETLPVIVKEGNVQATLNAIAAPAQ